MRWAEQRGYEWFVLSAKHGVVAPDDVLEPYKATLSTNGAALAGEDAGVSLTEEERKVLFAKCGEQLRSRWPGRRFVALVGSEYLPAFDGLEVETPLAGMKLGRRVSWLNRQVADYGQPEFGTA